MHSGGDGSLNITLSRGYLFHTILEALVIMQAFCYELNKLHKTRYDVHVFLPSPHAAIPSFGISHVMRNELVEELNVAPQARAMQH